jgi:hypothetical protein
LGLSNENRFSEIATNKLPERIDISQPGFIEISRPKFAVLENNLPKTSVSPNGVTEIAAIQNRVVKLNPSHIRTSEVNIFPSRTVPNSIAEISVSHNSTTQIDANIRPLKIDSTKIDTSKQALIPAPNSKVNEIAFPSSKSSEKFFTTDFLLFGH